MTQKIKPYLSPQEVAAMLMVGPGTVRLWAEKGLLAATTTAGGHRRFMRSEVERFMRELQQAPVATASSLRILIVEDDDAVRHYLVSWLGDLEDRDTEVATAADGFTAGQMLGSFRPDIILLDLMMPGIDGFQVCRQVKENPASAAVRVIAMTGYPTPENVEKIVRAGAECCLSKPLDEEKLLALLISADSSCPPAETAVTS